MKNRPNKQSSYAVCRDVRRFVHGVMGDVPLRLIRKTKSSPWQMSGINLGALSKAEGASRAKHAAENNALQRRPLYRTPMGGRGPRLLWLLWAEGSVSMCDSPLPALALALPVRLLMFFGLGG